MARKKERPDGFVMFGNTLRQLMSAPPNIAGEIVLAGGHYFFSGTEPEFTDLAQQILWQSMKSDIDRAISNFAATCERNAGNAKSGHMKNAVADCNEPLQVATSGNEPLQVERNRIEKNGNELNGTDSTAKRFVKVASINDVLR